MKFWVRHNIAAPVSRYRPTVCNTQSSNY